MGDPIVAGHTGLYALQAPPTGLPPLVVRHAGPVLERPVAFTRITLTFDGSKFTVQQTAGEVPAGQSRLVAPEGAGEGEDAGTVEPPPTP